MMEARLRALTVMRAPDATVSRRVRKPALAKFDIEMIVKEERRSKARWFLVRWEGYHPSWEAWRINGLRGEPVETWEPLAMAQDVPPCSCACVDTTCRAIGAQFSSRRPPAALRSIDGAARLSTVPCGEGGRSWREFDRSFEG